MGPNDYSIDVQQPFQAALQGFQGGLSINQAMQQQQAQQQALAQQQQMQRDLAALASNPNAGARDYASMMTRYPQLSEQFKRSWDVLNANQQQNKLAQAMQVYAAIQSGRQDVASKLLNDQAQALRNSGNDQEAQHAETIAKLVEMDPNTAKTTTGLLLSSVMGPEKFAQTFSTLGDESRKAALAPAEQAKAEAEAKIKGAEAAAAPQTVALKNADVQSQIQERAGRLALDKDKLTSDVQLKLYELGQKAGQLDDGAKKIINDSTIASVAADQSAGQMLTLADQLEQSGAAAGATAKGAELYKSLTGNQDAVTKLRQEYVRIRNSQAMKLLPPGPASDKDVEFAMKGFPPETADPAMMASFLRGVAKLQQRESVLESARAEWVNSVGHLGKPKADIEVDGIKVPAGATFTDFARQFLDKKTEQRAAATAAQTVQGRSYMRFAQPAGAQ